MIPGRHADVEASCGYEFTVEAFKPLNDAIAIFWRALERHQWSVVCKIGAVCCVAITRKLVRRRPTERHCDRDKAYVDVAKARGFHPGALAVLQSIACLSLASSDGSRWHLQDILLRGLHQFCTVPRDIIAHEFAITQVFPARSSGYTSAVMLAQKTTRRGAGCEAAKARAAWVGPLHRARALQAYHEVCKTLLPVIKSRQEHHITVSNCACTSHFSVRLCVDTASWNLLLNISDSGYDKTRSRSTHDAALLWEDARALIQDKDAVDVEEIALVALQLDMLAGLNMQDVRSMLKMKSKLELRRESEEILRRILSWLKQDPSSGTCPSTFPGIEASHAALDSPSWIRQSLVLQSKMDGACCAALGFNNITSGVSTEQMSRLLLHLDSSMISPCIGGEICVKNTLAAVTKGLIEHSNKACSALRNFPGAVPGAGHAHTAVSKTSSKRSSKPFMNALASWIEVMEIIQQRRWWLHDSPEIMDSGRCGNEALLQQARHVANRLGCNFSSVLHLIVAVLLVLDGPVLMQKAHSVATIITPHMSFQCERFGEATDHRAALVQQLYNNILTLWQHHLLL